MNGVTSITVTEDITLITFNQVESDLETISEIFSSFSDAGINIDMISQTAPLGSHVSLSFSISSGDLIQTLEICNGLRENNPNLKPLLSSGNTKVQLYGDDMKFMHGVAAKAISTVAQTDAEVALITTSEVDISLLLTTSNVISAIEALENEFDVKHN